MIRSSDLELRPLPLREANAFVALHHRHHGPARGCVFSVGCFLRGKLVAVSVVGRPVARNLQDGVTLEVTRLCSDGTPNACSRLLGAVTRACTAIGVRRVVTYTLASEGGASLRAANWRADGVTGGGSWSRVDRPREDRHPLGEKQRWTFGDR